MDDMKHTYSKPTVNEQEISTSTFIAGSIRVNMGEDIEYGTTDAGRSRDEWGNLWSK